MKIPIEHIPSPCYTLIEESLIQNLELLAYVQKKANVQIICALKGFSMWAVFPTLAKYLSGATASSLHEAKLIAEEMGRKAHTYCPAYNPNDIEQLALLSSHITFNSMTEYRRWIDKMKQYNKDLNFGIRINPGYSEIETDIYNPAIPLSRLGVSRSELGHSLPEGISGLHFHLLCEQDSYVFERVLAKTIEQFGDLFAYCRWINMGGGHLITRKGYDVEHLISLLKTFQQQFPNAQIILEPGEAIGWETGFLLATVLDIIEKDSLSIAMLDVSFAAHMPDTLEMPYKPRIRGTCEDGDYVYRFGGTTCLAGDFMGDYKFASPLHVGDKIIFEDMIHYTMVKTTFFNGVHHPSIGKIDLDGNFHLLKQFGYNDFKNKLS